MLSKRLMDLTKIADRRGLQKFDEDMAERRIRETLRRRKFEKLSMNQSLSSIDRSLRLTGKPSAKSAFEELEEQKYRNHTNELRRKHELANGALELLLHHAVKSSNLTGYDTMGDGDDDEFYFVHAPDPSQGRHSYVFERAPAD